MLIMDVITIFPEMFIPFSQKGIIKDAFHKNICQLNLYNLRDFSKDKHRKIDDRPYGGGPGMIMTPGPIYEAISFIKKKNRALEKKRQQVIMLSPKGELLKQDMLKELSCLENIILLCGRYEGVDERVLDLCIDREISIGDYVLTGGEVPAMVIIDGVTRLLPNVLNKELSAQLESFEDNLLDYPQYTRPPKFKKLGVPEVLLKGNHQEIERYRREAAYELTKKRRPDLIDKKG
jgi:tRNA (guanine37-N1)-methyltransferase